MNKKFDINQWLGTICLMIFYIYAYSFSSKKDILSALIYFTVTIVASVLSVLLMTFAMNGQTKSWVFALPITGLMFFANLLFGWNAVLPFFLTMICGVCSDASHRLAIREITKTDSPGAVITAGVLSSLFFLILTIVYGIYT